MAFEHESGLPDAYDRANSDAARARVVWKEGVFLQGADLNEAQTLAEKRGQRVGNMVASDGDIQSGASIVINTASSRATLSAGSIYIAGDVRPVGGAVFNSIPLTGEFTIGVKLVKTVVTYQGDTTLLGLGVGTLGEGQEGAARVREAITWALSNDSQPGTYYPVYLVKDGTVIDQRTPPALTGVNAIVADYDYDALGHYAIDRGCLVRALGKTGNNQVFEISAGTANIQGWKRKRETSIRHVQLEEPDLETITAEPITMTGPTGGTSVLTVARAPISAVISAVIVKRITQTVTRGATANGSDALQFSSVLAIESVVQGGTTYTATTDYLLTSGSISWAPAGLEPAASSTYNVTYLYNDSVTPSAVTDTTVSVVGGVNGQQAQITYTSKMPRIDLIGLDITGRSVYVKGIAARTNRLPPLAPDAILKLAEIENNWLTTPVVNNNGPRNFTFEMQQRLFQKVFDLMNTVERGNLDRDLLSRAGTSALGRFTDSFVDDFYRDQGASQTLAINNGALMLAIDATLLQPVGTTIETLPYTEEIVFSQELATSSMLINPYDNFTPFPASMTLEPAVDFWTTTQDVWLSSVTQEFAAAPNVAPGTSTIIENLGTDTAADDFLRSRTVTVTLEGFGVGERLATLTMGGNNVFPGGTFTADSAGRITVAFTIPTGLPRGRWRVRATGQTGSFAEAFYFGQGTVVLNFLRRVFLVTREAPPPVVIVNNVNNVVIVNNVVNQIAQPVVQQIDWQVDAGGGGMGGDGGGGGGADPLAQSFALTAARMIVGADIKFTVIGNRANGVRVQLSPMVNGFPSNEVLAEAFINMQTVSTGVWTTARFRAPVYLPTTRQFCIVILTADPDHSVSISKLGDVYDLPGGGQARVAAQPYATGVLFASANRLSWTPVQEADLTFRLVAARFSPTTRTINMWTGALVNISDFMVRGGVETPDPSTTFRYELVRATGQVIPLAPGQNREFSEYLNETVTVRAVLNGSTNFSPILYPGTLIVGGTIRTSGFYITRQFPLGSNITVRAVMAQFVPAGGSVSIDVDAGNGTWVSLTAGTSTTLGSSWNDVQWSRVSYSAVQGRIRVTFTGGPAARTAGGRLRAWSF